jgi:ATP synthase (E/31 kDa) subunit
MRVRITQVAFIKQEALEKARELRVKADEEFAIEKVSLEYLAINLSYICIIPGETSETRTASNRCTV